MKCIYNSITNPKYSSELYKQLLKVYPTVEEADEIFVHTQSKEFIDRFGDWISDFNKTDKENYNVHEMTGEPKLYKDIVGNWHFIGKDGKILIERIMLNFPYEMRKSLVDMTMIQLFGDNITDDIDLIDKVNLNRIFTDKYEGSIYDILEGNTVDLEDIKTLVQQRLKQIGIVSADERDTYDYVENAEEKYEITDNTTSSLDHRSSIEKSSKDNATANIKYFMSFIPEMEYSEDGKNIVQKKKIVKMDNGEEVFFNKYHEFDHIWNITESALAGIVDLYDNGTITEKFGLMLEKLAESYPKNGSIAYLISILDHAPEWKKTQFVQAFDRVEKFYETSLFVKTNYGLKYRVIRSASSCSLETSIIKNWNANFAKSKLITEKDGKPVFNRPLAVKLKERYNVYVTELADKRDNTIFDVANFEKLIDILKYVGVKIDVGTLGAYMDTFSGEETTQNHDLYQAASQLKYLFGSANKNVGGLSQLTDNEVIDNLDVKPVFTNFKVSSQIKKLAKLEKEFRVDLSENTVKGAKRKTYWIYSMPSFINNRLERLKEDPNSELPRNNGFYKNSILLNAFRDSENNKDLIKNLRITVFHNFHEEFGGDEGTDNKDITQADQAMDMLNKMLMGVLQYEKHRAYTLIPYDKGAIYNMEGAPFHENVLESLDKISEPILDIFSGYFLNELHRIHEELEFIQNEENIRDNPHQYINHYHFKLKGNTPMFYAFMENGKEILTNEKIIKGKYVYPSGNAFKIHLFPELSPFNQNKPAWMSDVFDKKEILINLSDETIIKLPELRSFIDKSLRTTIELNKLELSKIKIYDKQDNTLKALDHRILSHYEFIAGNKQNAVDRAIADFTINSLMNNIEYSMAFTGDWAYFKNLPDFSKRIRGTYTDGLQLTLKSGDDPDFVLGVMPNVTVSSKSLKEIEAYSPELAKSYSKTNATGAQGWITWDRWKFVMERSNHWTPKFAEAVQRMEDGTAILKDFKYAAQPIKGVHYEVLQDGRPVYIKYSALVLVPSVIKGTGLEKLDTMMKSQGVDEAVVIDGIKVGATIPSDILGENGKIKEGVINKIKLRNNNYKIQQEFKPTGINQNFLDIQIIKTLMTNFKTDQVYSDHRGKYIKDHFMELLSDMSNKGLTKLSEETGIGIDGTILNREKLTYKILESLSKSNTTENLKDALRKEYDYSFLTNHRNKIQNTIISIINNSTVKFKTHGGMITKVSSWCFDSIEDAKKSGVMLLLNNFSGLNAPRISIDENGKRKILSGQIFLSGNYIAKYIPNWKSFKAERLMEKIDSRLLKIIGFKNPNKGFSSIDSLEIIGFLPESMGDIIVQYGDITAKSGSYFDNHKMFVMIPNGKMVKGRLEYITYNPELPASEQSKEAVENRLMEMMEVILGDEKIYQDLMTPLDCDILKKDINDLHGNEELSDIGNNFFSPMYQLQRKFERAGGKSGLRITKNQISDHMFTQVANVSYIVDLGFVNLNSKGETSFAEEYDLLGEQKISNTLSWFLKGYLDIANDPYINKGNHNKYTSHTVFMLLRAGCPWKFVNRLVGQPIIKKIATEGFVRKSRQNETYSRKLKDAVIEDNDYKRTGDPVSNTANEILARFSKVEDKKQLLTTFQEKMENDIKNEKPEDGNWRKRQLEYLNLYEYYHEIGEKFTQTILSSKQDVNGGGKDFISVFVDMNRKNSAKNLGFINFDKKFKDTYLGTVYKNSTELSIKVLEKLFFTANESARDVYNKIQLAINPQKKTLLNKKLGFLLEKSYENYILEQTTFRMAKTDIKNMFVGKNSIYERLIFIRKLNEVSENYFLAKLEVNVRNGITLLMINPFKNNSKEAIEKIEMGWKELLNSENAVIRNFGKDLIYYSFYIRSLFFSKGDFFENIPSEELMKMIQIGFNKTNIITSNGLVGKHNFHDKFFQYYMSQKNKITL